VNKEAERTLPMQWKNILLFLLSSSKEKKVCSMVPLSKDEEVTTTPQEPLCPSCLRVKTVGNKKGERNFLKKKLWRKE